jgi:hypothetical protein
MLYMECFDNPHGVSRRMCWVQKEVVGEGNDRAWHFQNGARFCLQPLRARAACPVWILPPVFRDIGTRDLSNWDVIADLDTQQLIAVRQLAHAGDVHVDKNLKEGQRGVFGQIDDGPSRVVPSSRSAEPTDTSQIRVVAYSPEGHQAK